MPIKQKLAQFKNLFKQKVNVFLHKRKWNYLVHKQNKILNIIFVAEGSGESEIISFNTLSSADYTGFECKITMWHPEALKSEITSKFQLPQNIQLFAYSDNLNLGFVFKNCPTKYDYLLITSSHIVFHKNWFQEAHEALKSVLKYESYCLGGFSSFNPNDFKLLKTIKECTENSYAIKNGFSFNCCIYPEFIIKEIESDKTSHISPEAYFAFFRTNNYYFAFPDKGYADGHSYDAINTFDKFHPYPNNLSFATKRVSDAWEEQVYMLPRFKRLVIHINYGGLGDHLFLSHLPRIAKEKGFYKEVYISKKSVYRHTDYKKLIWDLNPYVDGFTDEMGYYIEFLKFDTEKMNILDHIMQLYGIDDLQLNHEPDFYYKPEIKPELANKIVFDPNYVSDAADKITVEQINNYFKVNNIAIDFQMQKRDKSVPASHFTDWLSSHSLEDFCSIIASCKEIYCFATGTATLAAALGKKAHVFFSKGFNPQFLHSKNNEYIKLHGKA